MTPFGIRKRLKKLILGLLGADTDNKTDASPPGVPAYKRDTPVEPAASAKPPSPSIGAVGKPPAAGPGSAMMAKPAKPEEPDDSQGSTWVQVANLDALISGEAKSVDAAGRSVALYNVDGEIFATQGECGHAYGPLGDGVLSGHTITCPLHEWEWDVRDGSCVSGEDASIKTVGVKIKKNRVMVKL